MHEAPRTRRISEAQARVLCYALGPFFAALLLRLRQYGGIWSVRFHAFHSVLMSGVWAAAWGGLRLIEHNMPWFLATVFRELRFAMNLGFILIWVLLLATAYEGRRCAAVRPIHEAAVRLARKFERS